MWSQILCGEENRPKRKNKKKLIGATIIVEAATVTAMHTWLVCKRVCNSAINATKNYLKIGKRRGGDCGGLSEGELQKRMKDAWAEALAERNVISRAEESLNTFARISLKVVEEAKKDFEMARRHYTGRTMTDYCRAMYEWFERWFGGDKTE